MENSSFPSGLSANGGWLKPVFDEGVGAAVDSWFDRCGALLLGHRTYDKAGLQGLFPEDRGLLPLEVEDGMAGGVG